MGNKQGKQSKPKNSSTPVTPNNRSTPTPSTAAINQSSAPQPVPNAVRPNLTVNPNAAPLSGSNTFTGSAPASNSNSVSNTTGNDSLYNTTKSTVQSQSSTPTGRDKNKTIDNNEIKLTEFQTNEIVRKFDELCRFSLSTVYISRPIFMQHVLQPMIQHLNLHILFVDRIYNSIDSNKNGTIEFNEYEALQRAIISCATQYGNDTKYKFCYNVCDVVGNNKFDKKVWKLVLCALLCGTEYDIDGNEISSELIDYTVATSTNLQLPTMNQRLSSDITPMIHNNSHLSVSPIQHRQLSTGPMSTRGVKKSAFNLISSSTADAYSQLKFHKPSELYQRNDKLDTLLDNYFFFVLYNYDRDNDRILTFNEFQRFASDNDELSALADSLEQNEQFYTQFVSVNAQSYDDDY